MHSTSRILPLVAAVIAVFSEVPMLAASCNNGCGTIMPTTDAQTILQNSVPQSVISDAVNQGVNNAVQNTINATISIPPSLPVLIAPPPSGSGTTPGGSTGGSGGIGGAGGVNIGPGGGVIIAPGGITGGGTATVTGMGTGSGGASISVTAPPSAAPPPAAPPTASMTTVTQANGRPLPNWLSFDPKTGKFTGTSPRGADPVIDFTIVTTDSNGKQDLRTGTLNTSDLVGASRAARPPAPVVFTIDSKEYKVGESTVTSDVAPYINAQNRTILPLRAFANALGVSDNDIVWNGAERSITIFQGNRIVKVVAGQMSFSVNGTQIVMDTTAALKDGRIFLPVRAIGQALGKQISWDEATRSVTVAP